MTGADMASGTSHGDVMNISEYGSADRLPLKPNLIWAGCTIQLTAVLRTGHCLIFCHGPGVGRIETNQ